MYFTYDGKLEWIKTTQKKSNWNLQMSVFDNVFLWKPLSTMRRMKWALFKTIDHRSARPEQTQTSFQVLHLTPSQLHFACFPPASQRLWPSCWITCCLHTPWMEQVCSLHHWWEGEEGDLLLLPAGLLRSAKGRSPGWLGRAKAMQAKWSTGRGVSGNRRLRASLSHFLH